MGRYLLEVGGPFDLLADVAGPREGFERIWALLPPFSKGSVWAYFGKGHEWFIKGQIEEFNLWPKRMLRRGRILRERQRLAWMRDRDLPVPEVMAWGAEYRWGLPVRTFLVQRRITDATDMQRYLSESGPENDTRVAALQRLGEGIHRLHRAGLAHRDLYLRNILIAAPATGGRITFIDCPRAEKMRRPRAGFLRRADLYAAARDAMKCGASNREVEILLHAAGEDHPAQVIRHANRALRLDKARPCRSNFWLIFGI